MVGLALIKNTLKPLLGSAEKEAGAMKNKGLGGTKGNNGGRPSKRTGRETLHQYWVGTGLIKDKKRI